MTVLGAILRGGRSSRFGSDKGAAQLGGVALDQRVRLALAPQVDRMVAVGGAVEGLPTLADRPGPDLGPLAGLNAALHYARDHGFAVVLTAPCDAPLLPDDLLALLAPGPSYLEPMRVIGLWPASLADALDEFVRKDPRRSLLGWAAHSGARSVACAVAIPNVNTAADLAMLEARLTT